MKNGLEVFDLKEEDKLPEYTDGQHLCKFKNPSLDNPAIFNSALGSIIVNEGRRTDVNEGDNPHNSSNIGTALSSLEIVREDFATRNTTAGLGAKWQSQSPSNQNVPCPKADTFESKSSSTGVEARFSCPEAPSTGERQSTCALVASPLNSGSVNLKSEADESDKSSPSSSISNIAENDGIVDGRSSDSFFSASEMDTVNIAVDYVSYGDNYYTGCMVIFSSDGIKISGDHAYGELDNIYFEREIDDIIRIESQQLRRSGTVTVKFHFLPKDTAKDVNTDGIELLELAMVEQNWSGKFKDITSLNVKYLAVSSIVQDANFPMDGRADIFRQRPYFPSFDESVEDVVYPKGDSDAVSISKRDFELLLPETFVNDTIIDFYIKYLKNQIPSEEKHRFHFFNSFFFRKLADLDKDPSSASDGRAAFLRVHKWTRKVDVFGKDYVFIPVNFSLHWSLIVICHPGEVAGFKDEDLGKSSRVPCILHMDSIKGTHAGLKNLMQSYLWEEWKARQKDTSDDLLTKFLNLRFVPLELPQQENSFDCGLFLLHYLELFLAEAPLNFSPFKINKSSNFLAVDWFTPAEASLKRTLIQRLISGLLDNHTRKLSFGDCRDEPESCFPQSNMKETAAQLVSERCSLAVACQGEVSSSDANQGIEITLLQSSMRNVDCVNDPGLVLKELFEPGVAAGSLLTQRSSFDEQSYHHHYVTMSQQIEGDEETEDPFMYFPSGDAICQQAGGVAPQSGFSPSLRGYGANPSWKQGDFDALSPETSACASDDSDVGIIENCPVQIVQDLCQSDGIDKQAPQSTELMDCLAGTHASISNEELESSVMKISEDLKRVNDGNENDSFSIYQDLAMLQRDQKMVENGLHQQSEQAEMYRYHVQTVGGDCTAEPDEVMVESDEEQTTGHNMVVESDEKQSNDSNVVAESNDKPINYSNIAPESDEKQTNEINMMSELNKNQSNNSDVSPHSDKKQTIEGEMVVELDKKHTEDSNLTRESNGMQTKEDSNVMAESDENPAKKRRRVTLTDEGGAPTGNLSEDLHL